MKALIVDGEEIFRLSLKEVVSLTTNFSEIVTASSEHEFVDKSAKHENFDLILIHPNSVGDDNNVCYKLARRLYPNAAVVTIKDNAPLPQSVDGSVVNRSASISELTNAIRSALKLPPPEAVQPQCEKPNYGSHIREALQTKDINNTALTKDERDLSRLSHRQREILAMAADGNPNKEIAARLDIAEGTVKAHMHAIFRLLNVTNRTQAVIKYNSLRVPFGDKAPKNEGLTAAAQY